MNHDIYISNDDVLNDSNDTNNLIDNDTNNLIDNECPICLLEMKSSKEMACCNNFLCDNCYNDWHIFKQNTTCVFCRFDTNIQNNNNTNQYNLFRRFNNKLCISCVLLSFTLLITSLYIVKLCCLVVY